MKPQFLLVAALMGLAGVAAAHDDATLDKMKAPNGGQLRMAGPYHYELVVVKNSREVRENPVVVYLTDHGEKKISSAGVKGTASILAGALRATVTLAPDGDNRLKGFAKYASDPSMKVVVTLTHVDGRSEQARFEPLKAAAEDPHAGHPR